MPIQSLKIRVKILNSFYFVHHVFVEENYEQKKDYIDKHKCNLMIMGDDHFGRFDWVGTQIDNQHFMTNECGILYLQRTPNISTTEIVENIWMKQNL